MPDDRRPRNRLDDGEDVSSWSDRDLLIRAVNGVLETNGRLGLLARDVAKLERKHIQLEARVEKLEQRPPMPSAHDLARELERPLTEAVEEAVEKTNPNLHVLQPQKSDSERVRKQIVAHENEQLATRTRKILFGVLLAVLAFVAERVIEASARGHW